MDGAEQDPAGGRRWTVALADELTAVCGEHAAAIAQRPEWVRRSVSPHLASALLLARLVSLYAAGEAPDKLAERLRGTVAPAECASADALAAVLAVTEVARSATLPGPFWWEPWLLVDHLATMWARDELDSGTADVIGILQRDLSLPESAIERICEQAAVPELGATLPDPQLAAVLDSLSRTLGEAAECHIDDAALAAAGRPDLETFLRHMYTLQRIEVGLEQGDVETAGKAASAVAAARRWQSAVGSGFTVMERLILAERPSDDELVLRRVVEVARRFVHMSGGEAAPLTDLIGGQWRVPDDLERYFALGGHTRQSRHGLIASWAIAFEQPVPDGVLDGRELEIGLMAIDDPTAAFPFALVLREGGEQLVVPITYPARSPLELAGVALLALLGAVRVDLFVMDARRSVRHTVQHMLALPEDVIATLTARVAALCRHLPEDEQELQALCLAELTQSEKDIASIGFVMSDRGKSEPLLPVRRPGAVLGRGLAASPDEERQLSAARRATLAAHADAIAAPGEAAETAAARADDGYGRLVQRLRGEQLAPEHEEIDSALVQLTDGLVTDKRAVVHLAIDGPVVELLWADAAAGRLEIVRQTLPQVDLAEIERALERPDYDTLPLLDAPDGAGMRLGAGLHAMAAERGVEQLILCPTRFLHGLPFGALPIGDDRRLMDALTLTYAPSCAILQSLRSAPMRGGNSTFVATFGLRHGEDEARFVSAVGTDVTALSGSAADPAAVLAGMVGATNLHFCCHGRYVAGNYLASRLELAPEGPAGELTVARFLAEADVEGVDLAVLGSCFSGAGHTERGTLDAPGGIDSAFLAAGVRNVVSALWAVDDFAALIFHAELYLGLAEGALLVDVFRDAVGCLRSGAWREIESRPAGQLLTGLGVDLCKALDELSDDTGEVIDFSEPSYWAPFRICGLGWLQGELEREGACA
jgi:hypothetical protein